MMKRLILDANVLIRFLRGDHAKHYRQSCVLMEQAEAGNLKLVLLDAVVAEVVFVLSIVYKVDRKAIADALRPFLVNGSVECPGEGILRDTFSRWTGAKVDFMDAYLAAHAAATGYPVCTFDQDFRKFRDIAFEAPGQGQE